MPDAGMQAHFYRPPGEVREAYSDLLQSLPWDYYITQTYRHLHRDTISAPARWWEAIQPTLPTRAFVAVEPHYLDGIHLHCLVKFPRGDAGRSLFHRLDLRRDLRDRFGFVNVEAARTSSAVATYCAKYVTKGHLSYEFQGNPDSWSPEPDPPPSTSQLPLL
ncbi:hypothetical protein LCGC14_1319500 [marine sediment metagenome]|uniref:Uncharacterized protein n=1 Tax=marine sediment metagenome TaxID=412755 RepID=A0A0F9KKH8_9ZZZZ